MMYFVEIWIQVMFCSIMLINVSLFERVHDPQSVHTHLSHPIVSIAGDYKEFNVKQLFFFTL